MQALKNFSKDLCCLLGYAISVVVILYFYYMLGIWKLVNRTFLLILSLYLANVAHLSPLVKNLELIVPLQGKIYSLALTPECSAMDIGLIFGLAPLFTPGYTRRYRLLGFLLILALTYIINIFRLLATLYFLTISEGLFTVMHQVIFRMLMFLALPGIYLSWYHAGSSNTS